MARRGAALASGCAALALTVAPRASALDCAERGLSAPGFQEGVPTNTLVWCSKSEWWEWTASEIELLDSAGARVEGTQSVMTLGTFELRVFRPASELAPNSTYTKRCPPTWAPSDVAFSTGAGPSHTVPSVPAVSSVEVSAGKDVWGEWFRAFIAIAPEPGTLILLDIGGKAALASGLPSGVASDIQQLGDDSLVWVGKNPCGSNWPEAALGASTTVALGAFDLTGAFSGWSDAVTIALPSQFASSDTVSIEPGVPEDLGAPASGDAGTLVAESTVIQFSADGTSTGDLVASTEGPRASSGCALDRNGASHAGVTGLLAALAGLVAMRRRARPRTLR